MTSLILGLLAIGAIVWIYFVLYNGLIARKNQVDNAFASIDVLLTKRCELIPKLVTTVKEYMQFEQRTLAEVTRYRSRAMSATGDDRIEVENQLSRAIGNIMIAVEAYPDLKANEQFQQLLRTFNEVEEQLSAARRFYNSSVNEYNNAIEMVPSNLIASQLNYRPRRFFEATERQRQDVDVQGLFRS